MCYKKCIVVRNSPTTVVVMARNHTHFVSSSSCVVKKLHATSMGGSKAQFANRGAWSLRDRAVNDDGSRPKRFEGLSVCGAIAATVVGDQVQAALSWLKACSQMVRPSHSSGIQSSSMK